MSTEGYTQALALLRRAAAPHGILASVTDVANYRRVWARDGVVCGLAGLVADDKVVATGLRATLQTLARCQGPDGQIPSNVLLDSGGDPTEVSLGGLAGRVDTQAWFVIGVCSYARVTGDRGFAGEMAPAMQRALDLLTVWEFNRRGLVYVPQGGDWADEYFHHGYVLFDQLLRLWALRCHAAVLGAEDSADRARQLAELIRVNYWPRREDRDSPAIYHPRAFRSFLETRGEPDHWLMGLTPGGYLNRFDAWSNALSVLLELPDADQLPRLVDHGEEIRQSLAPQLAPAFWPPVIEGDPEWRELQTGWRDSFRNVPFEYHNGGVWPMISGWWGMALCTAKRRGEAGVLLDAVHAFNRKGLSGDEEWEFHEYGHAQTGRPGGTSQCSWSAAGAVLLDRVLNGRTPFFG